MDMRKLSDPELEQLNASIGAVVGSAWADPSLPEEDKRLEVLLPKGGLDREGELEEVRAFVLEYIRRFFLRAAFREYLIMDRSGDWGILGEQRISISFCRAVLGIPNDRSVTQIDAERFRIEVEEYAREIARCDPEGLRDEREREALEFLGMHIPPWDMERLESCLRRIGVPWTVYFSYDAEGEWEFLLADYAESALGPYTVRTFGRELVRSPHKTLMVAGNNISAKRLILVRTAACETIFHNKWMLFMGDRKISNAMLRKAGSAIQWGLKNRVFLAWGIESEADFAAAKEKFLGLVIDSVSKNLVGYQLIHEDPRNTKFPKPIWALMPHSDDFPQAIDAVLADWMSADGVSATMGALVETSRTDPTAAEAMFWCTLSDFWFADESEDLFPLLTDLSHVMAMAAIGKDGRPDFALMESLMPEAASFLFAEKAKFRKAACSRCMEGNYLVDGAGQDFEAAQELFRESWRRSSKGTLPADLKECPAYSTKFWSWARATCPDAMRDIDAAIADARKAFDASLLGWAIERCGATAEDLSPRAFLVRRYSEIGVWERPFLVEWREVYPSLRARLGLPDGAYEAAVKRFESIIGGESLDVEVSYEGAYDPFIACLQELLAAMPSSGINAPMLTGEHFPLSEPREKRRSFIREELESLMGQIESGMFPSIERLVINEEYSALGDAKKELASLVFSNGAALRGRMGRLEEGSVENGALFAAHIPIVPGFMDWNTSQAVYRVASELRPGDYLSMWTIDEELLDHLAIRWLRHYDTKTSK